MKYNNSIAPPTVCTKIIKVEIGINGKGDEIYNVSSNATFA